MHEVKGKAARLLDRFQIGNVARLFCLGCAERAGRPRLRVGSTCQGAVLHSVRRALPVMESRALAGHAIIVAGLRL